MSEQDVRELLVRAIAAVKTGQAADRDEARLCLERVLHRDDAEPDQKAHAWLWLSYVENDPKKKRECLESVLAIDPGHGSARRELAILDGRLKAQDVIDPDKPIQPVKPALPPDVRRSVCPKCGGTMSFDADRQKLICGYCGDCEQPPQPKNVVQEQDFFAALPTARARLWELPAERVLKCDGCGATFALPSLQVSGSCPFCRSPHIMAASTGELIQPQAILPFQFDGNEALKRIHAWIEQQRFCPKDLNGSAASEKPHGLYLPFWTFDLGGTMDWRALVAERHGRNSRWVMRNGVHLVYHDDLLVPASRSLPREQAEGLLDFDTRTLVPYSADLLADNSAEIYQVPLAEASLVARQRALEAGRSCIRRDSLAGTRYRDLVVNTSGLIVESYKLVLLPLWIGSFAYRNKDFPIAMNGQTGAVSGSIPRGTVQRALVSLFGSK